MPGEQQKPLILYGAGDQITPMIERPLAVTELDPLHMVFWGAVTAVVTAPDEASAVKVLGAEPFAQGPEPGFPLVTPLSEEAASRQHRCDPSLRVVGMRYLANRLPIPPCPTGTAGALKTQAVSAGQGALFGWKRDYSTGQDVYQYPSY